MHDDNPFFAYAHEGRRFYHVTADDRIRAVNGFNLAQCESALGVDGLQKTVERAVRSRMRVLWRIAKNADAHRHYIEKLRRNGAPLAAFPCPACAASIEAERPAGRDDRPYTTAAKCPGCGTLYFRTVHGDGTVDAEVLP